MRGRFWHPWLAGSVTIALVGIAPTAEGSGRAAPKPPSGTISITDRQVSAQHIDQGSPGKSAGDLEISWQALYNQRVTRRAIGHSQLVCTLLTLRSRQCSATYFFPRGKLIVDGVIASRLLYELPVTGGTGIYVGARGSLLVTRASEQPLREILQFRLLG
jgi:allene oxide cyclase